MAETAVGGPAGGGSTVAAGFKVNDASLVKMHETFTKLTGAVRAFNTELKTLTAGAGAVDKVAAAVARLTGSGGSRFGPGLNPGHFTPAKSSTPSSSSTPAPGGAPSEESGSTTSAGRFSVKKTAIGMGVGAAVAGGSYLARHLQNIEAGNLMFNQIGRGQVGTAGIADIRKGTFGEHGKAGGLPFYTDTQDALAGMSAMMPYAGSYGTARFTSAMSNSSEIGKLLPGQGAQGSMSATAGMLAPSVNAQLTAGGYGGSLKPGGGQRNLKEVAKSIEKRLWGGPAPNEAVITEGMQPGSPLFLDLQFLPQDTQQYVVQYMLAEVRTKGHADQALAGKSKSDKAYAKQANIGTSIYDHHAGLTRSLSQQEQETGEEASGTLKGSFDKLSSSVNKLSGMFSKLGTEMAMAMLVVGPAMSAMNGPIGSALAYGAMNRLGAGGRGVGGAGGPGRFGGVGGVAGVKAGARAFGGGMIGRGAGGAMGMAGRGVAAGLVFAGMNTAGNAMQTHFGHGDDNHSWHVQDAGKGAWTAAKWGASGAIAGSAFGPVGTVVGGVGGALAGSAKATWDYFHHKKSYSAKPGERTVSDGTGGGALPSPDGGTTKKSPPAVGKTADVTGQASSIIATAESFLGTPYKWGGSTPKTGFDCSGLTQWAYGKAGIKLPRTAHQQQGVGKDVPLNALQPADLVFWGTPAHHVGMAVGGGNMVAAPHTGDVVKIQKIYGGVANARRILNGTAGTVGGVAPTDAGAKTTTGVGDSGGAGAGVSAGIGATSELDLLSSLMSGAGGGRGAAAPAAKADDAAAATTDASGGALGGAAGVGGTDAAAVWANLIAQGFSKVAAAGIMGNMQSESGLSFDIVQGGKHSMDPASAGGGGYGLVQWTPGKKLIPLLHGAKPSVASEIKALAEQLTGGEKRAGNLLSAATTVKAASDAFELKYERHAGGAQPARARQGQAFYDKFAGKSHARGSWEIVSDEIAQLHKGEMVLPEKTAAKVRQLAGPDTSASGRSGGHSSVTVHAPITVMTAMSEAEINRWVKVIERKLEHSSMLKSIAGGF